MAASLGNAASALPASVPVGVVGAGAMGAGIAQVAALAGHPVLVFDTRPGAAAEAVRGIHAVVGKLLARGRVSQGQAESLERQLQPVTALEELAGCGLVIEAIVENLEAKRDLFRSLEKLMAGDAIFATNTSSISITSIAAPLAQPEQLAGLHFFNPAPLMPLVEVISGLATSPAIAQTLYATARAWGKTPVFARSTPGFIVNRVARPFYAEALRTLQERAADCATLDAILRESGGFRMGPFELMDLIGHDVNYAVTCSVFAAFYGDTRFTPSLLQLELVEAGLLGRKAGRGFYQYADTASASLPATCPPEPPPSSITLYGDQPMALALADRLTRTSISFARVAAAPDGRLADCDTCVLSHTDGRTATQRAATDHIRNLVLVDLALDPATATRLAIAPADTNTRAATSSALGLLQAAGYQVSPLDDIAGMIVFRTVVMLANEAADAVLQGVCTPADCDLAMQKGVNYPRGPLAWADELGAGTLVQALERILAATGETRYRVSPLLRRKALSGGRFFALEENPA